MLSYVYWKHPFNRLKACSNIYNKSCIRSEGSDLTFARYSSSLFEEKSLYPQGNSNRKIYKFPVCKSIPQGSCRLLVHRL